MKLFLGLLLILGLIAISCNLPAIMPISTILPTQPIVTSTLKTWDTEEPTSGKPTKTPNLPAQVLTETSTPQPTELVIIFPKELTSQAEGITTQFSKSAKNVMETYYGIPIQTISINPTALTLIRNDFIDYIFAMYSNNENIFTSDKIWFLKPVNNELSRGGSQIIINTDPKKYWDISKPVNLFVVIKPELENVRKGLKSNDTLNQKYYYSLEADIYTLIYNDETGATNVYTTIDYLTLEYATAVATRCPLCGKAAPIVNIALTSKLPLHFFAIAAQQIAATIGKHGFTMNTGFLIKDLGCGGKDGNDWTVPCSAVTIK